MHKAPARAGSGKGYIASFSCDRDLGEMLGEISTDASFLYKFQYWIRI